MPTRKRFLLWLTLAVPAASVAARPVAARADMPLKPLRGVRRVLFLGDSITYAGGYIALLDVWLARHAPNAAVELIDAGLPSETVSGLTEPNHAGGAFPRPVLSDRLGRALEKVKPDLVVACYGMNDGIYYPFDTGRFRRYQEGIRALREAVRKSGARLWLLTPPAFDPEPIRTDTLPAGQSEYPSGRPFVGYDGVLTRYADWLLSLRRDKWDVTDIHAPLNAYLSDCRITRPGYALASDGVHLNDVGHALIARELLRAWGAPEATLEIVESDPPAPAPELLRLAQEKTRLLADAWLTAIGHKRPGMAQGLPLDEARARAAELTAKMRQAATPPKP